MAKRSQKAEKSKPSTQEFVILTFVGDLEQTKEYESLLKSNEIPVVIQEQNVDSTDVNGFALLVPEESLDEAHVVIEYQDAYDDFYDFASEEEDADFDTDFFDDDF